MSSTILKESKVIPDVLPDFSPSFPLEVKFGDVEVVPGIHLTKPQTAPIPTLLSSATDAAGKVYTVAVVDPDAPMPEDPKYAQINHFVQTDLVLSNGILTSDKAPITPWIGANPPAGSPAHRYVFAIYEQKGGAGGLEAPEGFPTDWSNIWNRVYFKLNDFVAKCKGDLELVGATFFYVAPNTEA